jgi:hypothetical protein
MEGREQQRLGALRLCFDWGIGLARLLQYHLFWACMPSTPDLLGCLQEP